MVGVAGTVAVVAGTVVGVAGTVAVAVESAIDEVAGRMAIAAVASCSKVVVDVEGSRVAVNTEAASIVACCCRSRFFDDHILIEFHLPLFSNLHRLLQCLTFDL